jgi:cytochrome bd-type quinol oxidase subunit 2
MNPIKKRSMVVQVLLIIMTLGFYAIYWFYQTAQELKTVARDESASPALWTLLLFVPFGILYSYFQYAELYEKVSTEKINKWIIFILWFCFSPAVWFMVQRDLNNWAEKGLPAPAAAPLT